MATLNAQWANLAARVVRTILAKKDIGYGELSRRLTQFGNTEDEKALASRVALGRVRLSLLLQIFYVTDADFPALWRSVMGKVESWEAASAMVLREEMMQIPPMDMSELADKLIVLGVGFMKKTLITHIESGNIFLPDFLKCLVILRSHSLDGSVDYKDLISAMQVEKNSQE